MTKTFSKQIGRERLLSSRPSEETHSATASAENYKRILEQKRTGFRKVRGEKIAKSRNEESIDQNRLTLKSLDRKERSSVARQTVTLAEYSSERITMLTCFVHAADGKYQKKLDYIFCRKFRYQFSANLPRAHAHTGLLSVGTNKEFTAKLKSNAGRRKMHDCADDSMLVVNVSKTSLERAYLQFFASSPC